MNERWAISIDIEGFSKYHEYDEDHKTYAILALGELMKSIYKIGVQCFPGEPENKCSERLFAHQYGDGFLICSDFPERDASRAIAIAIAIMRHMILKGYATKSAISCGDLSDIKGCYPSPMSDAEGDSVYIGMGHMTIISVMGTALTKAHKLSATKSGAVIILDDKLIKFGLPVGAKISSLSSNCIDWVSSNVPLADQIAEKARLKTASAEELIEKLHIYCTKTPKPPCSWIKSTFMAINCDNA